MSALLFALAICCASASSETLSVGGAKIRVEFEHPHQGLPKSTVILAIKEAATSVAEYYGRFPVPTLDVQVKDERGSDVIFGTAYGGKRIVFRLGTHAREKDLKESWMLTHEMSHLAFPDLDDSYNWMEEGFATYIEPVMRARQGIISETKYWRDILDMMPGGLPHTGEPGLNLTDDLKKKSWERWRERTYWGGAIYWFTVDYRIRKELKGKSLRDLLIGFVHRGGDGRVQWPIEKLFHSAREILGSDLLKEEYLKVGPKPGTPDIHSIWKSLGVAKQNHDVVFDNGAPDSAVRKSMTSK